MNSLLALLKREYLEHRGAFVYFPSGILALLGLSMLWIVGTGRGHIPVEVMLFPSGKSHEVGYGSLSGIWWVYMAVTVFFYFANAFSADRRNNSMFFWKSMPQSDFKILGSKLLAGVTMFPAIIFGFSLVTGLLLLVSLAVFPALVGSPIGPDVPGLINSYIQVSIFALVHLVLSLLWYLPFLAWVGALSAAFGRWSIPLSVVIPGLAIALENILLYGHAPRGGYIYGYLAKRFQFGFADNDFEIAFFTSAPANAGELITRLTNNIDWFSMGTGLAFALLALYAASEYRRRAALGG